MHKVYATTVIFPVINVVGGKIFENLKILKNFIFFFWIFHEKIQYSKASTAMKLMAQKLMKEVFGSYFEFTKL